MNYEDLYEELKGKEKTVREGLSSLQKFMKTITRENEGGDIKGLLKDLDGMADAADSMIKTLEGMLESVKGFDTRAYFEQGEFAQQMLAACKEKEIDVRGDFPVYEMFPYRVKLDAENQDVYLDRKKIACMRPKSFVEMVKKGQEKLNRAAFNEVTFANELAEVYDLAVLRYKKIPGADIYLTNLYKVLAPLGRFRKDYDQQSFAFDLARLYRSGLDKVKDGRSFQFGPVRKNERAFRILDQTGTEQFLATIRFFEDEG